MADHVECALEVDAQDAVPVGFLHECDKPIAGDACIVHQRLDGILEILPDLGDHILRLLEGGYIADICLGLDAMWQLVGFFLGWRGGPGKGRALGVNKVKFKGEVIDSCKLVTYEITIKRIIERGKLIMGVADGKVFADGKHIYTAEDLQVGLIPPAK